MKTGLEKEFGPVFVRHAVRKKLPVAGSVDTKAYKKSGIKLWIKGHIIKKVKEIKNNYEKNGEQNCSKFPGSRNLGFAIIFL